MSDNYEWMKANEPQSLDDFSPYTDKQYSAYINDINNGVYANNSSILVNFDLGQLYNSNKYLDTSELYCVLPITMVAAYRAGNNLVTPTAGSAALCSIKTNFLNLIHQCDLTVNGRTIESTSSFINVARHFQLASEMSINDLATIGPTLGFAPTGLVSVKNMKFNATAAAAGTSGNDLTNNHWAGTADNQSTIGAVQNAGVGTTALQYKIGRYIDMTDAASTDNGIASIVTVQNLATEYRPYHVRSGQYMIWYDYVVIRLSHLFESLSKFGLLHRFDAQVRLWVNTGTVNVTVANPNSTTNNLAYSLTPAGNTFSNTCPLMINYLPGAGNAGGIPDTVNGIVAGLFIGRSLETRPKSPSISAQPLFHCSLEMKKLV